MAGAGQRFRDAGYRDAKFAIVVQGRTLFEWSMDSLRAFIDAGSRFIFMCRRADHATSFIEKEAVRLRVSLRAVIELDAPTDGQATTAMLAGPSIEDVDAPVFIYNIDTYVNPTFLPTSAVRGDGWIPCFPGEGSAWSFARADQMGRVNEVREKIRISPHATVGLYWFSSFALYQEAYQRYYSRGGDIGIERYVAPMYNDLIERSLPVYLHEIPAQAVVPLGTPADVERFSRRG
jgi:NDP-sugar pyrophosphorylase family protein